MNLPRLTGAVESRRVLSSRLLLLLMLLSVSPSVAQEEKDGQLQKPHVWLNRTRSDPTIFFGDLCLSLNCQIPMLLYRTSYNRQMHKPALLQSSAGEHPAQQQHQQQQAQENPAQQQQSEQQQQDLGPASGQVEEKQELEQEEAFGKERRRQQQEQQVEKMKQNVK